MGRSRHLKKQAITFDPPYADIATKFNDHFLQDLPGSNYADNEYLMYLNNAPSFSMYLRPTNRSEVENILKSLQSFTPGYDDVSPKVQKNWFVFHASIFGN